MSLLLHRDKYMSCTRACRRLLVAGGSLLILCLCLILFLLLSFSLAMSLYTCRDDFCFLMPGADLGHAATRRARPRRS
eukprot:1834158-Rhodomonas_salina.1